MLARASAMASSSKAKPDCPARACRALRRRTGSKAASIYRPSAHSEYKRIAVAFGALRLGGGGAVRDSRHGDIVFHDCGAASALDADDVGHALHDRRQSRTCGVVDVGEG